MPFAPSRDVFPLDPLPRVRPRPNSLARHAPPGQPKDSKTYIELRGRRFTSGNQVFRKLFQLYANVRCGATGPERDAPTGPGRAAPRCSRRPCPPDTLVPPFACQALEELCWRDVAVPGRRHGHHSRGRDGHVGVRAVPSCPNLNVTRTRMPVEHGGRLHWRGDVGGRRHCRVHQAHHPRRVGGERGGNAGGSLLPLLPLASRRRLNCTRMPRPALA